MFEIGNFVQILKGHDKNTIGVIIGFAVNGYPVFANGKDRKVQKPKMKNPIHLKKLNYTDEEISGILKSGETPTNKQIKKAINSYLNT